MITNANPIIMIIINIMIGSVLANLLIIYNVNF